MMYGKFFASTFTGSMMGAGPDVFSVWAYVIANTVDSAVELNPALIGALIGITPERAKAAIAKLCEPDPRSRSKAAAGSRLIRDGEFSYTVPNHAAYRSIRSEDDRRAYNRRKQAEHRARKKSVNTPVNDSQSLSSVSAHTEADTEAEADTETGSSAGALPQTRARVEPSARSGKADPGHVTRVPGTWGPSDWKTQYGRAWCYRYRQVAYGMPSDSKACAALADVLDELPQPERIRAQADSARMFAEFLGSAEPRVVQRRHPFAFFVQEWGGLRVPRKNSVTSRAAGNVDVLKAWIAKEKAAAQ